MPSHPASQHPAGLVPATLLALAAILAWDASGLDLPLAHAIAGGHGFPLRHDALLLRVLHDGGRWLSWALALALCLGVWWPFGALRQLRTGQRLQLAVGVLAAGLAVTVLKGWTQTSCPWDLADFGGVARYTSHWSGVPDGGPGHCFPAGHAAAGFAFVSGFFAFRGTAPPIARRWLAAAVGAGLLFGIAQQVRGAHFLSHTLWTAWICWVVCGVVDRSFAAAAQRTANAA